MLQFCDVIVINVLCLSFFFVFQSISNSTGSSNKVGKQKCALLDCDNSGQTVAWGRVFSTDPADKVHFIPLGPNASKVWVEVSKMDDAPNSEIEVIADALGAQ